MKPTAALAAALTALVILAAGTGRSNAAVTYPIVDTAQDVCYDAYGPITCPAAGADFYGQDAQNDGNQPHYTLSADGLTVHDDVTGLTWVRMPDTNGDGTLDTYDQLTWSEFLAYPDTLNAEKFGGYDDWRAPTIKELYSLMDFRGTDPSGPNPTVLTPFINTDYFDFVYGDESLGERLIDAQYWTTSQYTGTVFGGQIAIFGVNFADGRIKGYPRDIGPGGVAVHYARYVRGNPDYGINHFTDNGDGTITDEATGLTWSQDDSGDGVHTGPSSGMTWGDALAWVAQKNAANYLGHNDWRLPDAKEMQSILDYARGPDATGSAAIDPVFHITTITNEAGATDYPWFWTGTTHAHPDGSGSSAAYICFGRALGYVGGGWLDVHGAGAQRSDEKDGDFTGFTYAPDGHYFALAPQGDAVRLYNYVRLVRDTGSTTGVGDASPGGGAGLQLASSANPFRSAVDLVFATPISGAVTLAIYDPAGRRIRTLMHQWLEAGAHRARWDGTGAGGEVLPAGVYFAILSSPAGSRVLKMLRII